MPLISKCHFEDEFRDILHWIEQQFDEDFSKGIFYNLNGMDYECLIATITFYRDNIMGGTWDLFMTNKHSPQLETLIKDNIIILLYLFKKAQEENEKCALAHK